MKGSFRVIVLLLTTLMVPPKIVRFAGTAIVLCGGYLLL
jgi:hypothetical protein